MFYTTDNGKADGKIIASAASPNVNWTNCFEATPEEIDDRVNYKLTLDDKKAMKRAERDKMLAEQVDVINGIRFAAMTDTEKAERLAYRQYLLDIPQLVGFPEVDILTFAQWQTLPRCEITSI